MIRIVSPPSNLPQSHAAPRGQSGATLSLGVKLTLGFEPITRRAAKHTTTTTISTNHCVGGKWGGLTRLREELEAENSGVVIPTQTRWLGGAKVRARYQEISEGTSSVVAAVLGEATFSRLCKSGVRLIRGRCLRGGSAGRFLQPVQHLGTRCPTLLGRPQVFHLRRGPHCAWPPVLR